MTTNQVHGTDPVACCFDEFTLFPKFRIKYHRLFGAASADQVEFPWYSGFGVAPGSGVIFEEYLFKKRNTLDSSLLLCITLCPSGKMSRAHYEERARAAAAEGATFQRRTQLIASHNTGPATIGDQIPLPFRFPTPMRSEPILQGGHQEPARDVLTPPPQEFGEDGSPPPPASGIRIQCKVGKKPLS
jgi:hypothetical protein